MSVASYKERAAELAIGLSANSLLSVLFDWLLYPAVIYWLGIVYGGVVMTLLAIFACVAMIKFYDWSKRDWLGIEALKGLREYEGNRRLGKFMSWVLTKGNIAVFLFLSVYFDAFITTTYMRHGKNQYNGMSRRDWAIFTSSVIISNACWAIAVFMGISLLEWVWKALAV
jgi:hypothetical protein